MVEGLHSRHRRPHIIPGILECGHHSSVCCAPDREAHLGTTSPMWQNRSPQLRTVHGWRGQGLGLYVCKSTVTVWASGICSGGIHLLGSAHSHNTQTHGARSGTRDTHRPCEIKKKCLRGVCVQFLLRQAPGWRVRVRHAALAKNGDGAGQGLSPFVWEDFHCSSSQLPFGISHKRGGLIFWLCHAQFPD